MAVKIEMRFLIMETTEKKRNVHSFYTHVKKNTRGMIHAIMIHNRIPIRKTLLKNNFLWCLILSYLSYLKGPVEQRDKSIFEQNYFFAVFRTVKFGMKIQFLNILF